MSDQTMDERAAATPDDPAIRHADRPLPGGRTDVFRHPLWVRIGHWLNVTAVVILLMSGLNILMAHPHLYWGLKSTFAEPWLNINRVPDWLMIPQGRDLAEARRWHFAFAWLFVVNGATYLAWSVLSGRFGRRLWPTKTDLKGFWPSVVEHARLHFPRDEEARNYNVIQKLTYVLILLIVLPMMLVTGLSMSPGFNAIGPVLLEAMGGRQSARTIHFLCAMAIVAFVVVHVALVIWTGLANNLRAMITGWFVIEPTRIEAANENAPEDRR